MRLLRTALSCPLIAVALAPLPAQDTGDAPDRATLEARFEKLMTGCKMIGVFTDTDRPGRPPREEAYTISKVEKLRDDDWRFQAKIEYGGRSVSVPIVVQVRWAGDTAMIQVTDLQVPMLGKFTARVLIYRGRYAGYWQGANHGGHMYGRVVPGAAAPERARRRAPRRDTPGKDSPRKRNDAPREERRGAPAPSGRSRSVPGGQRRAEPARGAPARPRPRKP